MTAVDGHEVALAERGGHGVAKMDTLGWQKGVVESGKKGWLWAGKGVRVAKVIALTWQKGLAKKGGHGG